MKVDFLSEFELNYCFIDSRTNWPVKKKPVIVSIDTIIHSDYEYEKKTPDFNGWGIKNILSRTYYQNLKVTAKNVDDYDLYEYASWCLYAFNKKFKNQKDVDRYFGRV